MNGRMARTIRREVNRDWRRREKALWKQLCDAISTMTIRQRIVFAAKVVRGRL